MLRVSINHENFENCIFKKIYEERHITALGTRNGNGQDNGDRRNRETEGYTSEDFDIGDGEPSPVVDISMAPLSGAASVTKYNSITAELWGVIATGVVNVTGYVVALDTENTITERESTGTSDRGVASCDKKPVSTALAALGKGMNVTGLVQLARQRSETPVRDSCEHVGLPVAAGPAVERLLVV